MIGFGCETWESTLPEDEGERMGVGGVGEKERKKDRRKKKGRTGEESVSQGVFIWEKLGGCQPAETGDASFAVRIGINPLVLI